MFLEITPPWDTKQSAFATDQLFTTIHSLGSHVSYFDCLLGRKKLYTLELVSTKETGIRYLMKIPYADSVVIKNNLLSFLPGVKIIEATDYLLNGKKRTDTLPIKSFEMKLSHDFAIPLQTQSLLSQHDPIAYISGQMTNLQSDEFVSLQVIITPLLDQMHPKHNRHLKKIEWHLYHGIDISKHLRFSSGAFPIIMNLFRFIIFLGLFILLTPFTILVFMLNKEEKDMFPFWLFFGDTPKKHHELSPQKQLIHKIVSEKMNKELFETTIRFTIAQKDSYQARSRLKGFVSSLSTFNNIGYQSFRLKNTTPFISGFSFFQKFLYFKLKHRLLSFSDNPILSVSEVASLFHLPYFPTTQTEDLVNNKSAKLPAPLSLKQDKRKLDIVFANNTYAERKTAIGLTTEERRRHVYIIGATGTGKTTLLKTMIINDIINGKGICVIDPHGELITELLSLIPPKRLKDVVFFNPDDTDFPIGLNLLELPRDLLAKDKERYKGFIASSLISVFTKLYPPRYTGPRMEYVLRNVTLTALTTEEPTLFTIQRLLLDGNYRKTITATLKNPALILFWKEFRQMGSYQRAEVVSPITNKIGKFISDSLSANILGQKHSTITLSEIMDSGKILLCDVSKGKIGEDFSILFGALITSQIELAAQRRIRQDAKDRRDFFLYIDEFQNFASSSFAKIMSESRKYRLNAILAHQTIAQIEDHALIDIILANTGTVISFRTGSPLDEEYILRYFTPLVEKGEIASLPSYNFYIKINGIEPQSGFSGETTYIEPKTNIKHTQALIDNSQKIYGRAKEIVEKEIQKEFADLMTIEDKKETEDKRKKAEDHYLKKQTKDKPKIKKQSAKQKIQKPAK